MPCYHPLQAWRSRTINPTGKSSLQFNAENTIGKPLKIPCGQCIGCKLERSRQWAMRCIAESQLYLNNCFITLTYSDDCLPCTANGLLSLNMIDFQKFMKRLRKEYQNDHKIRFFACGEYGSKFERPHYHACLFNHDFTDKLPWTRRNNLQTYRSATLERLWTNGLSEIGTLTFESAAYAARYCTKKITGCKADEYYEGRDPEYTTMSRRPGLGKSWFDKFNQDLYPQDKMIIRKDIICKPAKYFDNLYDVKNFRRLAEIKQNRLKKALLSPHNTRRRLKTRETYQLHELLKSKRLLETKGMEQ